MISLCKDPRLILFLWIFCYTIQNEIDYHVVLLILIHVLLNIKISNIAFIYIDTLIEFHKKIIFIENYHRRQRFSFQRKTKAISVKCRASWKSTVHCNSDIVRIWIESKNLMGTEIQHMHKIYKSTIRKLKIWRNYLSLNFR